MTAATRRLQVFFRSDADLLHRMLAAANLDRTLVTAVVDAAVIKTVTKTLLRSLQEEVFGDPCSHGWNLWA